MRPLDRLALSLLVPVTLLAGPTHLAAADPPRALPQDGAGEMLLDANEVVLGRVMVKFGSGVTVLTSTRHVINLNFDGSVPADAIYYTRYDGGSCGGQAYLSDGRGGGRPIHGRSVFHAHSLGQLMVPQLVDATGQSISGPLFAAGVDNPGCDPAGYPANGWLLAPINRQAIGLPTRMAPPLHVQ